MNCTQEYNLFQGIAKTILYQTISETEQAALKQLIMCSEIVNIILHLKNRLVCRAHMEVIDDLYSSEKLNVSFLGVLLTKTTMHHSLFSVESSADHFNFQDY